MCDIAANKLLKRDPVPNINHFQSIYDFFLKSFYQPRNVKLKMPFN